MRLCVHRINRTHTLTHSASDSPNCPWPSPSSTSSLISFISSLLFSPLLSSFIRPPEQVTKQIIHPSSLPSLFLPITSIIVSYITPPTASCSVTLQRYNKHSLSLFLPLLLAPRLQSNWSHSLPLSICSTCYNNAITLDFALCA